MDKDLISGDSVLPVSVTFRVFIDNDASSNACFRNEIEVTFVLDHLFEHDTNECDSRQFAIQSDIKLFAGNDVKETSLFR